jgi:hypothetical protein
VQKERVLDASDAVDEKFNSFSKIRVGLLINYHIQRMWGYTGVANRGCGKFLILARNAIGHLEAIKRLALGTWEPMDGDPIRAQRPS